LITHAFDTLGAQLVGLRTDILNERSQRAIERLGAHKDGVLRHHWRRKDGSVRDTVMYSITKDEWPSVQQRLDAMLAPTLAG
jgi:N-acetyltransferase